MSIELTTKNIGSREIYYDNFAEEGVDCDITLPDYCPDITRILRCSVENNITNSKITGDRATADVNSKIRIVYADSEGAISCYDHDYPFSKYAELSSAHDNAVLVTDIKTEYVNCRAVSKRRIDIHGVVSIHFRAFGINNAAVVSSACGDGIQLRKKGVDIDSVCAVSSKKFQISEVKETGDDKAGIGRIVDVSGAPLISETKMIKGKVLLKGELAVRVVYCADTSRAETCTLCCNIPFNEIVEAENVDEGCRVLSEISIAQLTAEPKTDNDGEYRFMNINAELTACITAYCTDEVKIITDTYSTEKEIEAKYKTTEFTRISQLFSDTILCRQSLDAASLMPQKLFSFSCGRPQSVCRFEKDKMIIDGKIALYLIIIDEDNSPVMCEREAEFSFTRNIEGSGENLLCTPELYISGSSCVLSGEGKIDFKAEIAVRGTVFESLRERVLSELKSDENAGKKERHSSLTVYFCTGNESVWDIARKYNTTVEEIMEENNLTADYLASKTILMIPVK